VMLSSTACCSACISVISSNFRRFNGEDRKTSEGARSGEYGVGRQPPCSFRFKIDEQTKPRRLARCCTSEVSPVHAICVGVFLLTCSLRHLMTWLIVRHLPSWMI
jgi:hypothetical protein